MKARVSGIALMCISLLFGIIGQGVAEIDPETIVGLWLFDDGSGDKVIDSSGNNLDGKITGDAKWVDGKFGKGLEFDGVASFVEIEAHANPTEAITVSAWAKSPVPAWNQHGWIVEKRDAFIIHPNQGSPQVAFPICNPGCWNQPFAWQTGSVGPDDITEWHMYTGTFDSSTGEWFIYIDGEEASSLQLNANPLSEDVGPIYIGQDTCCAGRFGAGTVDEVVILSVALGADDIRAIFEKGFLMAMAVEATGKLVTTWADIKTQY